MANLQNSRNFAPRISGEWRLRNGAAAPNPNLKVISEDPFAQPRHSFAKAGNLSSSGTT